MEQRAALVTLGRCTWHGENDFRFHCTSGSSILALGEKHDDLKCRSCGHSLSTHEDYKLGVGSLQPATKQLPQKQQKDLLPHSDVFTLGNGSWDTDHCEPSSSWSATHTQIMTPTSTTHALLDSTIPRQGLIDQLIEEVEEHRIIRVNGIPGSGKTTLMHLMVNTLLKKDDKKILPIHTTTGWDMNNITDAGGWDSYLKLMTGVAGYDWLAKPAFLLIDEAHQLYMDPWTWRDFLGLIDSSSSSRIVLFTSYGLTHDGARHPGHFPKEILLDHGSKLTSKSLWSIGFRLWKIEAIDFVLKHASEYMYSSYIDLTGALLDALFEGSNGHIGLLKGFLDILLQSETIQECIKNNRPVSWATAWEILFDDAVVFFEFLGRKCFTKDLPPEDHENPSTDVIIQALRHNGISAFIISEFESNRNDSRMEALISLWRDGWLQAETDQDVWITGQTDAENTATSYGNAGFVFPTAIHQWRVH
ncbi:hypothetical protein BDW74DRAFT_177609 [Aspergillus multicolor]|uniref:uncharacterized protein n=1 Tax=Aspergillus multicolor TaxID=41759 RepID=UPI003CCD1DBF